MSETLSAMKETSEFLQDSQLLKGWEHHGFPLANIRDKDEVFVLAQTKTEWQLHGNKQEDFIRAKSLTR